MRGWPASIAHPIQTAPRYPENAASFAMGRMNRKGNGTVNKLGPA